MSKIEEIERSMYQRETKKKAKEIPRKELEELYCDVSENEYTRVNPNWKVFGNVLILILLMTLLFIYMNAVQYSGTEMNNYREMGKEMCEIKEFGNYKHITIANDLIKIECSRNKIIIDKED